jgi:hypothetical protein
MYIRGHWQQYFLFTLFLLHTCAITAAAEGKPDDDQSSCPKGEPAQAEVSTPMGRPHFSSLFEDAGKVGRIPTDHIAALPAVIVEAVPVYVGYRLVEETPKLRRKPTARCGQHACGQRKKLKRPSNLELRGFLQHRPIRNDI